MRHNPQNAPADPDQGPARDACSSRQQANRVASRTPQSIARSASALCLLAAAAVLMNQAAAVAAENIMPFTHVYRTVDGLDLKADVYRPDDKTVRPVILWIHGGALIGGSRKSMQRQISERFLGAGYAIVSIDYRLAPETKLPGILEDVEAAYTWLHDKGPELLHVDARKIAVMGGSAGGYLTLATGHRAQPRPAVLVALWGYGDLIGPWYSEPSEFYRRQPLVSREEALAGVSGPPVENDAKNSKQRFRFYLYCRQQGLWPNLVGGWDPRTDADKFRPYEPVRNVTADYPPTILVHGTEDTDVPHEQSVLMAREFERAGVKHNFVSVPGAGHGLGPGDKELVKDAYDQVFKFVDPIMREE